ncbi:hypothetical protein BJV85_003843 [Clostridium acetobutylicum]|uniref:Oxidoreductase n=1 Tax=Clostridium acetobutylicum (strain ATCC 824 / DSM 792 / JCM 1419 / IAM 19013 / LMG 5710 / NBRC 13948 / NRRL B-527 / VKM B-1787 / 2291 / W) TaxID=272562 RepID=Q97TU5_CLOAB|nr:MULTISPECIES: SDR family oxidoreductase [Clostridium]AAK76748.1 Oxidoreductase [Clostridium acetobutylicum ATCC 824]ADZ22784.1 Oxidoreductase [Clostridium acetobutylicum EA 2018]AEI34744.1 oxidoreductase [Clostridium acetobutylicum DSM 1731]AWV82291.1 SDR family NAD(P)-dependent oxidoreductase [Clostridium acetobutylicum]MBC2396042.1 SDR family oxidoreductase [Clostridium acetobutylicum]
MKEYKYTVITGASSGIGYEAAKAFAKRGKNLIIIARRREKLEELKKEILHYNRSLKVIVKSIDLSITSNVYSLYDELKNYNIETLVNNAGFGDYSKVNNQNLEKVESMLSLNIEALVILSSLFVRDYEKIEGTQLINISSAGGYTIVPNAVIYCATKFFVSSFTEGLARELIEAKSNLKAKVLAPAATETEFGKVASDVKEYDYQEKFHKYHTSKQMAEFLIKLYDNDYIVGKVDRNSFKFTLQNPIFDYA